jgi:hypothetical protein
MGRCPASLSWPIRNSNNLGEGPAPVRVAAICRVSILSYSDGKAAALLGAAAGWTRRLERAGSLSDTSRMGADAGTRIRDEGPPEAKISSSTPSSSTITDCETGSPSADHDGSTGTRIYTNEILDRLDLSRVILSRPADFARHQCRVPRMSVVVR